MASVFEEKNVSKAIMAVGLPAMLGQLTTLIYNLADTFFVSLTKEPAMIAAVTLCSPILLIIMSIACIFGMGGSSVIARLLGGEKNGEAGAVMNFCVYAMAIAGVVTAVLGLAFLEPLAKGAGADADNIAYTCDYLKWILLVRLYYAGKWIRSLIPFGRTHQRRNHWPGAGKCGQYGAGLCFYSSPELGNGRRRARYIAGLCVRVSLLYGLHDPGERQGKCMRVTVA